MEKNKNVREYMRPNDAARYLRMSASKLAKMRMSGVAEVGPLYSKMGACILYERKELDEWVRQNAVGDLAHADRSDD